MAVVTHNVRFEPGGQTVKVRTGTLITDAARQAGLDLNIPCGGQGRCGRCAVIVKEGAVRRRSTLRLSAADVGEGYALACQTVIEDDAVIFIPPQEKVERRLVTEKSAAKVALPFHYNPAIDQPMRAVFVTLPEPNYDDNIDDWSRLKRTLLQRHDIPAATIGLDTLHRLSQTLRDADWQATCILEMDTWDCPDGLPRVVDVRPGDQTGSLWGVAIDIGTTSNVVYLVNLLSGEVVDTAAEYNRQIVRGEDVISRIIYAKKENGLAELQELVLETLNELIARLARRRGISTTEIVKATVAGNSTMIHLFLKLPPEHIRLVPFITTVNHPPPVLAGELGLKINPQATVDCLPGVASYVGADISAGVLSSGLYNAGELTIFIDIGTNGEVVLGDGSWLISCACSAGPAFEGAGVEHGMRATVGAIEEVWINQATFEPTYRVIGNKPPRGICGSGLLSLLAEMFITQLIDKGSNFNFELDTPRVRQGEHGGEYVVAWGSETEHGRDIAVTKVDIDNLIRAKGAIYAGFSVLVESVGLAMEDVRHFLIGGAFGQYINIEKAIQIGLLPDLPWERFHFLGNTSVRGAYMALLSRSSREQIADAANKLTYVELSADNAFYDQFTSSVFLPHTDIERFPSVKAILEGQRDESTPLGAAEMAA